MNTEVDMELSWTATDGTHWETVSKDVVRVHLTVAKDRVTVKFPLNMSAETERRYMTFCRQIVQVLGPVEYTLRGNFTDGYVALHDGRRGQLCRLFRDGVELFGPDRYRPPAKVEG
jgi:hypothetical protein